ncbi:hypothetical protein AVEN_254247-1 [Araneus ventricosus]|uniref:Uncharacterized protein n=1 Tax=Araneus ventricosus TaxID=182803 RepID=A0A4Y2LY56_ARAVE|nr:hypothetical protein AVEN_254247-1 [Araneus ventricosus]
MASVSTAIRRGGERERKGFMDRVSKWKGDNSWARIDIPLHLVVAGNESRSFVEEVFRSKPTPSRALLFDSEPDQSNFFIWMLATIRDRNGSYFKTPISPPN